RTSTYRVRRQVVRSRGVEAAQDAVLARACVESAAGVLSVVLVHLLARGGAHWRRRWRGRGGYGWRRRGASSRLRFGRGRRRCRGRRRRAGCCGGGRLGG